MQERDVEVVELRRRVARLKEEARKNEEAWKRSQAREMELLEAGGLVELLERATEGLRRSYQLEAVTLVLSDVDHEIRHLLLGQGESPDRYQAVLFVDSLDGIVPPPPPARPRPWLGPYDEGRHARLFPRHGRLASVALLPLTHRDRVLGSLNMGSADPSRFTQSHATDFLNHLAIIAAFALENTVNRAKLVRSGFTDALTGWHNRRYLEARLGEEIARSARDGTSLACLMIDVDHFKRVNDEHGHLAGDDVLSQVARRIDAEVRSSDVSARYGGEEFIILLPGTDAVAGRALAERIRKAVARAPFAFGAGGSLDVTVSIGVADVKAGGAPTGADAAVAGERLIERADRALYEAKAGGRNLVVTADQD